MPTSWIYCRISQEDAVSVSIDTQSKQAKAYAKAHSPQHKVVVLADRDVSGGCPLFERPQGRRLLDAEPGDQIIVSKTDRVCRSIVDGDGLMEWCLERGVGLKLLDIGVDTSTAAGRGAAHVVLAFAQMERMLCSERRRAAHANRRQQGLPTMDAAHAPLGWQIITTAAGRQFKPDLPERAVCRKILAMRGKGLVWSEIIAKSLPRRNNAEWTQSAARRAATAAAGGFPLISSDCRRWGSESGRYRKPRIKRGGMP